MTRRKVKQFEVGRAGIPGWSAYWTVDTPYIEIYPGTALMGVSSSTVCAVFQRGESYPGAVHVLNTNGDLNGDGLPKDGRTPNEYVRDELRAWYVEDGREYCEAYGVPYSDTLPRVHGKK